MKNKTKPGPGPVHVIPTPVDPIRMEFQVMEDRISALNGRVDLLEELLRGFAPQGHGPAEPGGRPVIAGGILWGPVMSAPVSQDIGVCHWDSVMVMVSRPHLWGGGETPKVGVTVKFCITNSTGSTGPQISSGPNGSGVVAAPGGTIRVTTDALGQAFIYVHDSAPGKITLNADTSDARSRDIIINFV